MYITGIDQIAGEQDNHDEGEGITQIECFHVLIRDDWTTMPEFNTLALSQTSTREI